MSISDPFYVSMAKVVVEQLKNKGTEYKVRKVGTYDSETLTSTPGPERIVKGITYPNLSTEEYEISRAAGKRGFSNATMYFDAQEPLNQEDEVYLDDKWQSLSGIEVLQPANIPLMYIMEVHK